MVKVADFSERSAEMDDETLIAKFSALDSAVKDFRRRRARKIHPHPENGDD